MLFSPLLTLNTDVSAIAVGTVNTAVKSKVAAIKRLINDCMYFISFEGLTL